MDYIIDKTKCIGLLLCHYVDNNYAEWVDTVCRNHLNFFFSSSLDLLCILDLGCMGLNKLGLLANLITFFSEDGVLLAISFKTASSFI
jgi:hypothetical protein